MFVFIQYIYIYLFIYLFIYTHVYGTYDSETWTIKARDARRITPAEMKYMRTAGYTGTDFFLYKVFSVLYAITV
jgi:hypothetical protein